MDEKKVEVSIETAEKIVKNLEEKIRLLEIRESNILAQEHSKSISSEDQRKLMEMEIRIKLRGEEQKLEDKRAELNVRTSSLETQEERFRERLAGLQRREAEIIEIEEKRRKLEQERTNFNLYKYRIDKELEQAHIVIAEANASDEKIKMANETLAGREISVAEKEKDWNDRIGELEQERKNFEIMKQNMEVRV